MLAILVRVFLGFHGAIVATLEAEAMWGLNAGAIVYAIATLLVVVSLFLKLESHG